MDSLRRDFARPKGKAVSVPGAQLVADGGDVVDQPQLLEAVVLRSWRGVDVQVRKGEQARLAPLVDGGLDVGIPHQIGRAVRPGLLDRNVVVGASNLVFGAVLALREALITADVPLLARLAALAGLGVAREKRSASSTNRDGGTASGACAADQHTFAEEDRRQDQPLQNIGKG